MPMRFIIVECFTSAEVHGIDWTKFGYHQYRATCVTDDKTIDVFFFEPSLDEAKYFIRRRYPEATFSDEVAS